MQADFPLLRTNSSSNNSLSDYSAASMASEKPLLEQENGNTSRTEVSSKKYNDVQRHLQSSFIPKLGLSEFLSEPDLTSADDATSSACSTPAITTSYQKFEPQTQPQRDDKNNHDNDCNSVTSEFSVEEKILQVADQIEDDFEGFTYDNLVPLEVKLALENNVFGWDHLTSDILGHIFFTVAAFVLTYMALYFILEKTAGHHYYYNRLFFWLQWTLSLLAGWSSFRMVRRRRRIWLRAAYGDANYIHLDRMKQVEETDKSWFSKFREYRKVKKVEKKLRKADDSFLKHHERRLERLRFSSPEQQMDEDDGPLWTIPCCNASSPLSGVSGKPEKVREELHKTVSLSKGKKRMLSYRTESVLHMQSVQQDQITFANGCIQRVPYSHGAGFGAAPFMLANPHWISVLRHLMPDVYVEISRRINAPAHRLIHWAENNPVVAAYATAHELENNGSIPNIEWDVFLDPHLVHRVMVVLRERRTFLLSVLPELPTIRPMEKLPDLEQLTTSQRNVVKFYERELRKRAQDLVDHMLIAHGNLLHLAIEQTGFLKYYNHSRIKRTRRTLGGGIYARQWMAVYAEALRVGLLEESPPNSPSSKNSSSTAASSPPSSTDQKFTSLMDLTTFSCPNTSIAASIAIIKHIVKREDPFGLYLDVKSRHVPPQVWACVVDILREWGVRVDGVGAFVMDEIRTLRKHTVRPVKEILFFHSAGDLQQACHAKKIQYGDTVLFNAGSLLWTPISDVSVGLCQRLCGHFDPEATMQSYRIQPFALPSQLGESSYNTVIGWTGSTLEDYKRRYNLSIGLYVQEFAIDEAAANILVQLVNDNPQIYDLGLSWGGVNGITLKGIRPGRFTDTSGFWNQRHVGAVWDSNLRPPV